MRAIGSEAQVKQNEKLYDFECKACGHVAEDFAAFEDRQRQCECGGIMNRLMPLSAAIHHFDPYYNESLNLDITSNKQKKEVERLLNVIEAGDRVGGARNFDEDAPGIVDRSEQLSGRTIDTVLREIDHNRETSENFSFQTESEHGSLSDVQRVVDTPDIKPTYKRLPKDQTFEARAHRIANRSQIIS